MPLGVGSPTGSTRSFRDPIDDGSGLTLVLEQTSMLGGMERIAESVLARWPAASVVAPRFLDEPVGDLFADGHAVELPGRRHHHLAALHARRLERAVCLDGDVVLALHSSGWALGPRAAPGVPVVAFTSGTPRWTEVNAPLYVADRPPALRAALLAALPLQRAHQRRLRRRASVLLAPSRYAAALLPEPARVIHPPVDVGRFTSAGPDPDGHIVAIGRLVLHKRFDVLVEAMRGRPERLIVVGDGPERAALGRIAPPNVELAGHVDDATVAELLDGARALVHPNLEEFGIIMAEAHAAGVPVIAPRTGGAVEIVEDGRTGVLLDEVTPATIAAALDSVGHDPDACRASAERFRAERFLEELGAVLDQACGRDAPVLAAAA